MSTILIIFCVLAAITLATAFLTIFSKNPIHSAIYLVICFFSVAGHYLLLNAQFLAIVHIIVYSGAIMILFLFTIMLMNLNEQRDVLARLARLNVEELHIVETLANRSKAAATVVIGDIEVFVPLAGLIDLDTERQRLTKELTAAQIDAERRRTRLADETFVGKAPAAIVQRERDSLAAVDAQIARLQQRLVDYSN
jgi:NADH:ubiquinone oxidoreductase subunit 6 (subunit J)